LIIAIKHLKMDEKRGQYFVFFIKDIRQAKNRGYRCNQSVKKEKEWSPVLPCFSFFYPFFVRHFDLDFSVF
jgi:hypothetical protein